MDTAVADSADLNDRQKMDQSDPKRFKKAHRANEFSDVGAEIDDVSDEDMGFGLFDGSPPQTPRPAAVPLAKRESSTVVVHDTSETKTQKNSKDPAWDEARLVQELIKRQSFEGAWSNDLLPCDAMGIQRHAASVGIEILAAAHPELNRQVR
jgi:hypothetical protein